MAEFAAMPIFTDSLVADCGHLSDAEFGRYMRILIIMWRNPGCRIPNDRAWICKRLHLDSLQYESEVDSLLKEFCKTDGNWWTQKRLQKEFSYVKNKRQKQTDNAKSRWEKEKIPSHGNAPSPSPSPSKKVREESSDSSPPTPKTGAAKKTVLPTWLPADDWKDYLEMRVRIRKPATEAAKKQAIGKIDSLRQSGHDPGEVLRQSTFNAWQGIFKPKGESYETNRNHNPQPTQADRIKAAVERSARTHGLLDPDEDRQV